VAAVTAHTAMGGTITPLPLWFRALWEVASQESGTNPLAVQRVLGVPQEHAAWDLLTRVRCGLTAAARDPLRADVEIGTCYVEVPSSSRSDGGKPQPRIVAIASERCSNRLGRVRLRQLSRVDAETMLEFVGDVVAPGSTVRTGPWPGYAALAAAGWAVVTDGGPDGEGSGEGERPSAHRVAELLRLWLWGTPAATADRLDHYLDEFVFRFERRGCSPGLLFYHLLRVAIPVERGEAGSERSAERQAAAG
jgi:hypothetical protein